MFPALVLLLLMSIVDLPFGLSNIPCSSPIECERIHSSTNCFDGLCTADYLNSSCSSHSGCTYGQSCIANKCQFATVGDPCSLEYGCVSGSECAQNNCTAVANSCSQYICKAAPNVHYCSASTRKCPEGFFCPYQYYSSAALTPHFKCRSGSLGARDCFESKDCNGDLLCKFGSGFWNSSCVSTPDYAGSNAPDGFGVCKIDSDCPHRYYKKMSGSSRVDQHCVQGRCHSAHIGEKCKEVDDCTDFLSCINGRCDYATEGVRCRRSSYSQPCFPGHRCYNVTGGLMGTCGLGVQGVRCDDPVQCVDGYICGFNRRCSQDAKGQRCESDFWCPKGARCQRSSKTCTFSILERNETEFIPVQSRAVSCKTRSACLNLEVSGLTVYNTECLNGVCLPTYIGTNCRGPSFGLTNQMDCINGKNTARITGYSCDMSQQCYQGLDCVNSTCIPIIN